MPRYLTGWPTVDAVVHGLREGELWMPPFDMRRRSARTARGMFRFMPVPGTNLVALDTETERWTAKNAMMGTFAEMYGFRYDPMEEAAHRDLWRWAGFFYMEDHVHADR